MKKIEIAEALGHMQAVNELLPWLFNLTKVSIGIKFPVSTVHIAFGNSVFCLSSGPAGTNHVICEFSALSQITA